MIVCHRLLLDAAKTEDFVIYFGLLMTMKWLNLKDHRDLEGALRAQTTIRNPSVQYKIEPPQPKMQPKTFRTTYTQSIKRYRVRH